MIHRTLYCIVIVAAAASAAAAKQAATREFEITAERFRFTPEVIEVAEGDSVKLTIRSHDGTHGFAIKRLKIDEEIPKGGAPVVIQFVANEVGTFNIACSEYCGKGHKRMVAKLVVKPRSGSEASPQPVK
ncbi:MAG: cupredoxin domain-containing protein [Acidobacteria bacterium]|nr:cupredoxin domain-containing protein [Acidobacteriota bacterium]